MRPTRPGPAGRPSAGSTPGLLVAACHPAPTVAVTALTALLALAADLDAVTGVLVVAAVLAGQLTIGWGNDLQDAPRDRDAHRVDKPLASGALRAATVRRALGLSAVAAVLLSAAAGPLGAATHLVGVVGSGHAYNLGLKATRWSWLPYLVAFSLLPSVAFLAADDPAWAPWWTTVAAGMLGVAAHLLNVLPDLDDDLAAGVRGLPHRLGSARSRWLATALLVAASLVAALGPGPDPWVATTALAAVAALAVIALTGSGRAPFLAAIGIALVDVTLLVLG